MAVTMTLHNLPEGFAVRKAHAALILLAVSAC
jgi:zinc transporter ZupT